MGCLLTDSEKKPFYFDGNQWTGLVDSQAAWGSLLKAYERIAMEPIEAKETVLRAKSLRSDWEWSKRPQPRRAAFGFYAEYTGNTTLGQWLESLLPAERVMEAI